MRLFKAGSGGWSRPEAVATADPSPECREFDALHAHPVGHGEPVSRVIRSTPTLRPAAGGLREVSNTSGVSPAPTSREVPGCRLRGPVRGVPVRGVRSEVSVPLRGIRSEVSDTSLAARSEGFKPPFPAHSPGDSRVPARGVRYLARTPRSPTARSEGFKPPFAAHSSVTPECPLRGVKHLAPPRSRPTPPQFPSAGQETSNTSRGTSGVARDAARLARLRGPPRPRTHLPAQSGPSSAASTVLGLSASRRPRGSAARRSPRSPPRRRRPA